jgi:hypothetical protein
MRDGTFPSAIRCGVSVRWLSNEIEALRDFYVTHPNATKDELRGFVASLVAQRPKVAA